MTAPLARVLSRALSADPDRRFASAVEFQQALREAARRSPLQRALDTVRGAIRNAGRSASS